MKVVVTGATGFLGWHLRARLRALTEHEVIAVGREKWADLAALTRDAEAIVHVAGINRGADADVEQGNIDLATAVAEAARASGSAPRIVFANSIQSGTDSPYGVGKGTASDLLAAAAAELGSAYVDVRLPNLFGEHGRPRYNSFVATFVQAVVDGRQPQITDQPVALLHAQGAAQALIDGLSALEKRLEPAGTPTTVQDVLDTLRRFDALYATGDFPPLLTPMDVDLFNTLRAARFPDQYPIALSPRADHRGSLVEVVRAHGGQGQTFISTTRPGVTRGEHFHLRKVERFVVLGGAARISLRRLFTDEVVSFDVIGDAPVAVDMPTMWVHITNTGDGELTTLFGADELFDPAPHIPRAGRRTRGASMLKVMTIVGTRPELIRLSRVIARLDATVQHVLVHTGQNYDFSLNEVFFRDLGIRRPDHLLGVDTSSLGRVLGERLIRTEEVLVEERPDAVLILGDTNSSIAAVMAKRMRIPVYHMEAGNRCFDENVPEETNRRLVDHVADFNLVYTEHARRNLLAEGLHPRRMLLTGSPMREVLDAYRPQIDASDVLERLGLTEGGYFLASAHREENVDHPGRLQMLLDCLVAVRSTWGLPVHVTTHPRTRKRLEALPGWVEPEGIVFHEPFGFHDFNRLQLGAACVLSDSGTIAEESTILGFPAITLRDSIERPEALDTAGILMTGLDASDVVAAVRMVMAGGRPRGVSAVTPADYLVDNTADRVARFILSTARRHRSWSGIRGGER